MGVERLIRAVLGGFAVLAGIAAMGGTNHDDCNEATLRSHYLYCCQGCVGPADQGLDPVCSEICTWDDPLCNAGWADCPSHGSPTLVCAAVSVDQPICRCGPADSRHSHASTYCEDETCRTDRDCSGGQECCDGGDGVKTCQDSCAGSDPCAGVTCRGLASCQARNGVAACVCISSAHTHTACDGSICHARATVHPCASGRHTHSSHHLSCGTHRNCHLHHACPGDTVGVTGHDCACPSGKVSCGTNSCVDPCSAGKELNASCVCVCSNGGSGSNCACGTNEHTHGGGTTCHSTSSCHGERDYLNRMCSFGQTCQTGGRCGCGDGTHRHSSGSTNCHECHNDSECSGFGSVCQDDGTCSEPVDPCADILCGVNAECRGGSCFCRAGFCNDAGTCRPSCVPAQHTHATSGCGACDADHSCGTNEVCDLDGHYLRCASGYERVGSNCLEECGDGESRNNANECVQDSCEDGEHSHTGATACHSDATCHGVNDYLNRACSFGMVCIAATGRCACALGRHRHPGRAGDLGASCHSDSTCHGTRVDANGNACTNGEVCKANGACGCPLRQHRHGTGATDTCHSDTACHSDADCSGSNEECNNGGSCVCEDGYERGSNDVCLLECDGDHESPNAANTACVCDSGYERVGGDCELECAATSHRHGTDSCTSDHACGADENCDADGHYVSCTTGHERVGNACLDECGDNEHRNASDVCVCDSGYSRVGGACVNSCPSGQHDDDGGADSCHANHPYSCGETYCGFNMQCIGGVCGCHVGTHRHPGDGCDGAPLCHQTSHSHGCESGYHFDPTMAGHCRCDADHVCDDDEWGGGSLECTDCPAGQVPNAENEGCESCVCGETVPGTCDICGEDGCSQGRHAHGTIDCHLTGTVHGCPRGQHNSGTHGECHANHVCGDDEWGGGVTDCTACGQGSVPNAGNTGCTACGHGETTAGTCDDEPVSDCADDNEHRHHGRECHIAGTVHECDEGEHSTDVHGECVEDHVCGVDEVGGGETACRGCDDGWVPDASRADCYCCDPDFAAGQPNTCGSGVDSHEDQARPGFCVSNDNCEAGSGLHDHTHREGNAPTYDLGCHSPLVSHPCDEGWSLPTNGHHTCQQDAPCDGADQIPSGTSCSRCTDGYVPNADRTGCEKCEFRECQTAGTCCEPPGRPCGGDTCEGNEECRLVDGVSTCVCPSTSHSTGVYNHPVCHANHDYCPQNTRRTVHGGPCVRTACENAGEHPVDQDAPDYSDCHADHPACDDGFHRETHHGECHPTSCPDGQHSPTNGHHDCRDDFVCGDDEWGGGSVACTRCGIGLVPNEANEGCVSCVHGETVPGTCDEAPPCTGLRHDHDDYGCHRTACPNGEHDDAGGSAHHACHADHVCTGDQIGGGAVDCMDCGPGEVPDVAGAACVACDNGETVAGLCDCIVDEVRADRTSCAECRDGWVPDSGAEQCVECEHNEDPKGTCSDDCTTGRDSDGECCEYGLETVDGVSECLECPTGQSRHLVCDSVTSRPVLSDCHLPRDALQRHCHPTSADANPCTACNEGRRCRNGQHEHNGKCHANHSCTLDQIGGGTADCEDCGPGSIPSLPFDPAAVCIACLYGESTSPGSCNACPANASRVAGSETYDGPLGTSSGDMPHWCECDEGYVGFDFADLVPVPAGPFAATVLQECVPEDDKILLFTPSAALGHLASIVAALQGSLTVAATISGTIDVDDDETQTILGRLETALGSLVDTTDEVTRDGAALRRMRVFVDNVADIAGSDFRLDCDPTAANCTDLGDLLGVLDGINGTLGSASSGVLVDIREAVEGVETSVVDGGNIDSALERLITANAAGFAAIDLGGAGDTGHVNDRIEECVDECDCWLAAEAYCDVARPVVCPLDSGSCFYYVSAWVPDVTDRTSTVFNPGNYSFTCHASGTAPGTRTFEPTCATGVVAGGGLDERRLGSILAEIKDMNRKLDDCDEGLVDDNDCDGIADILRDIRDDGVVATIGGEIPDYSDEDALPGLVDDGVSGPTVVASVLEDDIPGFGTLRDLAETETGRTVSCPTFTLDLSNVDLTGRGDNFGTITVSAHCGVMNATAILILRSLLIFGAGIAAVLILLGRSGEG